jgi:urea transport system permease protein
MTRIFPLITLILLSLAHSAFAFDQGKELAEAPLKEKMVWIDRLASQSSERSTRILQLWLNGELVYWRKGDSLVRGIKEGRKYRLETLVSGESIETVTSRGVKRVKTNNSLRKQLKQVLGSRQLSSGDKATRLSAVIELKRKPDYTLLPMLKQREVEEGDEDVSRHLSLLIGLVLLDGQSASEHLEGLSRIAGDLSPEVREGLSRFLRNQQLDPEVSSLASRELEAIERSLNFWGIGQNLFFGISLGSVLLLAAIGLAITFGVMGVINMAHGEFIMLGAYTSFVIQQIIPANSVWSLIVSIPAAFVVSAVAGIILERLVIRNLYGRPLETLLATFGVSLILQQLVRTVFGPLNQSVVTPDLLSGALNVNAAFSMTYNRLFVILFALLVLIGLWFVLHRTLFGMRVRAVTMNRGMASSMGIRTERMDALAFGLGSGVAGMAGVALSQLTNVGPNLGQSYIIDSFMVVVFGGVGNLFGTVVAAFSLGVANKVLEPFSGAVLAKILILIFIILFIQKRPRGLFALKGRAIED